MKKTLASLVAVATIAVTLAATATDASAYWRGRGWGWGPRVAAGVIGGAVVASAIIASRPPGYVSVPELRQAGLRTRLLLDIPTGLRWLGPHRRLHGPARAGLPGLC